MGTEQSRGAPLKPLDDPTPLTGPTIDVGVRIGWLLRMARLTAPERPAHRLGDMVTRLEWLGLRTSTSSLHRIETGAVRDDRVVAAYEEALALAPHSLRASIDIVCRTFPYSPVDRAPVHRVASPEEMSRLHEPVLAGDAVGGQWREWARAMAQQGNVGLPVDQARDRVSALMGELVRSHGTSYLIRYDALATLRRSAWGGVVREAAEAVLADPHVQMPNDVMSAVGEAFDDDTRSWMVDLLGDPRELLVEGAAIGLGVMAEAHAAPGFWAPVLDRVVAHYNAAAQDQGERWRWLSHVLRLVPADELAAVRGDVAHPPSPVGESLRPAGREALVRACQVHAEESSAALGLPYQPLLARLLFEVVGEGRSSRSHASALLLGALPGLRRVAVDAVLSIAESHPDPSVRERATSRGASLVHDYLPPTVRRRLQEADELSAREAAWLAIAGEQVDEAVLRRCLRTSDQLFGPGRVLSVIGIAGSPVLGEILEEPGWSDEVRGAAAWWVRTGTRLVDPQPDATDG